MSRPQIMNLISIERVRPDRKWGKQNHHDMAWLVILMEEIGEVSECLCRNWSDEMNDEWHGRYTRCALCHRWKDKWELLIENEVSIPCEDCRTKHPDVDPDDPDADPNLTMKKGPSSEES